MNLLVNTKHRTDQEELMDDFSIGGPLLHDTLETLATINTWLGGNRVTINGLKILLKDHPKEMPVSIVDLGCGGGDILRDISKFGKSEGYTFHLIGIDANAEAVKYAEKMSGDVDNLEFKHIDIFSEQFDTINYDVVLCTLFLHHFRQDNLVPLINKLKNKATLGLVVNDLHRHRMAYYLFKLVCLSMDNQMIIQDGLTSVLRGFKRKEIEGISSKLRLNYKLSWKWAFRWQWIVFIRN